MTSQYKQTNAKSALIYNCLYPISPTSEKISNIMQFESTELCYLFADTMLTQQALVCCFAVGEASSAVRASVTETASLAGQAVDVVAGTFVG